MPPLPVADDAAEEMAETATSDPPWLYIGIACGAAALILLVLLGICFCCLYYRYKRRRKGGKSRGDDESTRGLLMEEFPKKKSKKEREEEAAMRRERKQRDRERKKQEEHEVGLSERVMLEFSEERSEHYSIKEHLPEIGSRLQKHWYRGFLRDGSVVIATEAPRTKHCRLSLARPTLDTINTGILPSLRQHPFIQPIQEIVYIIREDKILTIQPLVTRGSLRDYIFQESDPLLDWSQKYASAQGISLDRVALFGRQILEGVAYLYKQGFSPLGHVHSGNVMVLGDDHCKLGGYENTLLGYRTRLYQQCYREGYLKSIDIIMFGHVMYEMGYGKELNQLLPQEEDYKNPAMDSDQRQKLEDIVAFIFDKKTHTSFKPITSHPFFAGVRLGAVTQIDISKKAKRMLEDLSKGVRRGSVSPPSSPALAEAGATVKTMAQERVQEYVEVSREYNVELVRHLPDIGRRIGKYWSKVKTSGEEVPARQLILSISAVPEACPIHLTSSTEKTLNQFFTEVQHPYLHHVTHLHYVRESHQVILAQQMVDKGSVRDRILPMNPLVDWAAKLYAKSSPLTGKVALYGRQILEAVSFLYEQGFPPLGHVHTGNLFLEAGRGGAEVCKVGGYENTLLGFRTSQAMFANQRYSDAIDLRMFGHVIYEMSAGQALEHEVPTDADCAAVKGNRDGIKGVLSFIFSMSDSVASGAMSYKEGLQRVKSHSFFITTAQAQMDLDFNSTEVVVSDDMKHLLEKVRSKRKGGVSAVRKVLKKLETVTAIS